jgi:glycosyltransferase involved in cell wall biosynthesis
MKVLASAIACNPYQGSENFFGWAAIKCLAREHDLWVITSARNRVDLERAQRENLVPRNVRFFYAGTFNDWHSNALRARIQSWREYINFTKASLLVAQGLHRAEQFDLVHHVTFSTWRVPSPMWRLGIPFILGPIAGNEPFPFRLYPILSPIGATFETARKLSNAVSPVFPEVRRSVRKANHVFVITEEAEHLIGRMRRSMSDISRLSPGFYSAAKAAEFSRFAKAKDPSGVLRLYAAGNLGGQKCISVAIQALALAKKRGVQFRYLLGSGGPEVPHLKRLARKLDLSNEVIFGQNTGREAYQEELGRTHLYLLPSMRETVGLTMLEAMLAGCVPIVADNGGPHVTVTDECGYRIPVATVTSMAEQIAAVIERVDRDRQILLEKGPIASGRVLEVHSEDHYLKTVGAVYRAVLDSRSRSEA